MNFMDLSSKIIRESFKQKQNLAQSNYFNKTLIQNEETILNTKLLDLNNNNENANYINNNNNKNHYTNINNTSNYNINAVNYNINTSYNNNVINICNKNCHSKQANSADYEDQKLQGNMKSKNGSFKSLGIFYSKCLDKPKNCISYFDVYHRRIYLSKAEYIDDFFFNDVSDLINYKQNIINENLKQQKFFAKIAHEFKTPLNSVLGIIENIKATETNISHTTKKQLSLVDNLSNYLIFLVADMINYVNINHLADIKICKAKFKLKEILIFCFDILKTLVECNNNKKQNIKCDLIISEPYDTIEIDLDEIRVKQILLNFISNAVKFTTKGNINILCKKKTKQGNELLSISVKDSGIGIEEKDQSFIFQEFTMFENQLSQSCNRLGSGLGLSICQYLSKRMNVDICFKSKYMKGSKFSIEIPLEYASFPNKKTDTAKNLPYIKINNISHITNSIRSDSRNINVNKNNLNILHLKEENIKVNIEANWDTIKETKQRKKFMTVKNIYNMKTKKDSGFLPKNKISHRNVLEQLNACNKIVNLEKLVGKCLERNSAKQYKSCRSLTSVIIITNKKTIYLFLTNELFF